MIKFIIFFLTLTIFTLATNIKDNNITNTTTIVLKDEKKINKKIEKLLSKKNILDKELSDNNIWLKIYSNYHTYKELQNQQILLSNKIKEFENKKKLTSLQRKKYKQTKELKKTILGKLQLLEEYESDPFKKFLTHPEIEDVPKVENPFAIIGALSYQEKLNSEQKEYKLRYESLFNTLKKIQEKKDILKKLIALNKRSASYKKEYKQIKEQLKTFTPVLEIFKTTNNVHTKKIDEIKLNLKHEIKREMQKGILIGGIILFFILFSFLIKYLIRKYMTDNDRHYTINKALNIFFIFLSIFTILLAYIENVSYLVTILGFASAGIAIAMKDWFMSLLGGFTIVLGGSIHVGDRVKFQRGNIEYIGDIVDISLLRMTLHEDVTLTAYMHNRRAGRIIFIPNNYIFTDMIANYSHAGLKTVWDGVDFMITFDSDIHKATSIAKEVTRKYSKGYTDITRKQINKLRSQYNIRNTNVEPRILSFIEPYGMKISAWYLTNSFATLTLRSTISAEIITKVQAEPSITLAFPTQSIYMDKNIPKPQPNIEDILPDKGLY